MNRKKRIIIYSVAISLFVLGFLCIFIAAIIDDKVNYIYVNIIGFSSFGFMIASLILLVKNYSSIVISEMSEKSEKMHNEADFFQP